MLAPLQGAVNDLRQAASSEQAAAAGRLNACLARLAHTLDPTFTPPPAGPPGSSAAAGSSARLEVLELLTGVVQGAAMLAAVQRAQQPQQQPAQQQQQQQAAAAEPPSEEMEDPVAVELSRALRGLADLLEVPRPSAGWESAAALVDALGAALHSVVAQLPPGFFDPLLPPGALSQEQVRCARCEPASAHAAAWRAPWDLLFSCGGCVAGLCEVVGAPAQAASMLARAVAKVVCVCAALGASGTSLAREASALDLHLCTQACSPRCCLLRRSSPRCLR